MVPLEISKRVVYLTFIFLVLLVSTDPAHSLSDAFRASFGSDPSAPEPELLPNLDVMEVDPAATVKVCLDN